MPKYAFGQKCKNGVQVKSLKLKKKQIKTINKLFIKKNFNTVD